MAPLDQFPVPVVIEFFAQLVDRARMKDGSIGGYLEAVLTIDDARLIWAAAKHLDFYNDWGVGVEQTRSSLRECIAFLEEKKHEAKNDLVLKLDWRGIRVVIDSITHLDRLAIALEGDGKKSRKGSGKRR